ncbi:MAG TPA: GNAT family N-acetyltransferase [Opitutaceae bacterium]|nr:GNAT family N-acetyltransferase [Opitutaceae bacterium]
MSVAPLSIHHHPDRQRFEAQDGAHLAFLSYVPEDGRVIIEHTYVPEGLRGRGVGAALARAALEEARRLGWKIVPQCSFVADFIRRNPAYADLVAEKDRL